MLFPENYPASPDDLIFFELAPLTAPLYSIGYPPYANQETLRAHGVTSIEITPVLYERRTPEWYDGATDEDPVHEILLFFDPDEFPVKDYGLIFGDKGLEALMARHMGRIFPQKRFGQPEYSSLNEQGDDFVSMRYPIGGGRGFSREIRKDPDFFKVLNDHPQVSSITLVNPLTAERYRQAMEPRRPDGARPAPPQGLYAGMWITWGGSR
ncbi:hypothetical protein [Leisingera caerulea]|uniref:hypothetical protein n=1 Tax=Leisingera caerulea TaxID=506591 RepID=UPI0003FCA225|nr:hypothetical protein [Leisingera caerulea]